MPDSEGHTESDGQSTRDIAELVRSVATVMHQADVSELDLDGWKQAPHSRADQAAEDRGEQRAVEDGELLGCTRQFSFPDGGGAPPAGVDRC